MLFLSWQYVLFIIQQNFRLNNKLTVPLALFFTSPPGIAIVLVACAIKIKNKKTLVSSYNIPSEFWGPPTIIDDPYNQVFKGQRYVYNQAKFTIGRFIYMRRIQNNQLQPWTLVDENRDMYKTWYKNHPQVLPEHDVTVDFANVKCNVCVLSWL
jgi:hypothetical protein